MWTSSTSELRRICRDLAWSELASFPGMAPLLPPRWQADDIDLRDPAFGIDSLNRVRLATAAANWFAASGSGHADLFLARSRISEWVEIAERARREGAHGVVFSTSGSTGQRKHLLHAEATLVDEARAWGSLLPPRRRAVVLVPVHHLYGFIWGLLVPKLLDLPVVDAATDQPLALEPGDLVVSVPALWDRWLAGRGRAATPDDVIAVSSTAPLAAGLHQRLLDAGLRAVWDIYGSTETGGVGVRQLPDGPYSLAPNRWRVDEQTVAHHGADGKPWAVDIPDHLQWLDAVAGAGAGDAAGAAWGASVGASLDETSRGASTGAGRLTASISPPLHFRVGARRDGVVQVGGHNVDPMWVAEQIKGIAGVVDAAVRLDGSATDARLKAYVVLAEPSNRAAIELAIREQLPWYACPQRIDIGPAIPVNSFGKRVDWA